MLADHVAKTDRAESTTARGGGAWTDAARQAWALRLLNKDEADDARSAGFDPAHLAALEARKSNYTGPQAARYLLRLQQSEAAGVLQCVDFAAAQQGAAQAKLDRLQQAVLKVLAEHDDCTLRELDGSSIVEARRDYIGQVREEIGLAAGQKVTIRALADALKRMLANGELVRETDPETQRILIKVRS